MKTKLLLRLVASSLAAVCLGVVARAGNDPETSEIMQHKGVSYAGPLPAPYGLSTGYGAALASGSVAAKQLLDFLGGPQAAMEFRSSGFVAAP